MNKVSFVVPVYNVPVDYLKACLASIFNEAGNINYEIIVCNDGSDESLTASYDKVVSSFHGIKYISLESNKGINYARNVCLNVSDGDWIALLDADDVLDSSFGEKVKPYLANDYSLIYADHIQYDKDLVQPVQIREKSIYSSLLKEFGGTEDDPLLWATFVFHPQIYNKDALVAIGGFNEDYTSGDEVDAHILLSELYGPQSLFHIPSFLYKYRKNPISVVHGDKYYQELITNIQNILSSHYAKRTGIECNSRRIGRCVSTQTAHYSHVTKEGEHLFPTWFDMKYMSISYNKAN